MTGDPYNKHFTHSLSEQVASPALNQAEYAMFPTSHLPPGPTNSQFPLSSPQDDPNRFQQTPGADSTPFQFLLPHLDHATNSFVFSPPVPNSPPLSQSTSVVHFPIANSLFPTTNQFTTQKPNTNFFGDRLEGEFSDSSKFMREAMRCKRKPDLIDLPPLKQHITEEKMAESMSRLHICSETPVGSTEPEERRMQRLYMCDEMRRLQAESILPHQILSKIYKPCTALVPWRPPVVPVASTSRTSSSRNDDSNNNNNDEEVDNYASDSDKSVVEIEVESNPNMDMDL